MALTRAQLLAGNQNLGTVLPGQVQAVSQGLGIDIAFDGTISVDASTAEGLVRLNNGNAYNGYVWPDTIGLPDQFLQLKDASGALRWADASGFAVVVVSPTQPTSPDEGELWYNCNTGSLLVYQNCVSPGGWTNVAQPGKEVDPTKTSAVPPFANQGTPNAGTLANPYDCTVTTTTPGASVFIVNKVTITSLAPYQYVPIVDMNAVLNGGRFHFSNNYANAAGVLEFETIFIDLPTSGSGVSYTAAIRVGYATVYIDAVVNVVAPLSCTPGSISGDPVVNNQLTYTQGVASGGIGAYNYTWDWKDSGGNILASNVTTYVPTGAEVGQTIFVELTVTDSAPVPDSVTVTTANTAPVTALTLMSAGSISGSAATGSTLTYTPGSATGGAAPTNYTWQWKNDLGAVLQSGSGTTPQTYVIPTTQVGRTIFVAFTATDSATTPNIVSGNTSSTAVITGTPITNVQFPTTIPGTASFTWNNGNGVTLTATDCIEFEVNGAGGFVTSATVGTGNTIVTRWKTTSTCGGAAQGTTINGTLTTSTGLVSSASFTINRLPTGVTLNPTTRTANVGVVITPVNFSTTGANTAPLIWGILSAGTTPQYSIDNGLNWLTLPGAPNAANTIPPGVTALVRYTTAGAGTETLELRAGLSNTGGQYQSATLTTTVSLAPFPTPTWNPTGSLTTIPGLISGTYSGTGTTITSTGCIEVSTDGINFSQSEPISAPQTLYARWIDVPSSGTCGDGASGTTLNGSVSDGTYQNNYGPVTINRKPDPFGFSAGSSSAALSSLQTSNSVSITGINTTAYITLGSLSAGASALEARVNGGTWTPVPSAPSTSLAIQDTNTLEIRFVTGPNAGATYTAVVNVGDGDNVQFIASSPGLVVTNTTSAAFPGLTFTPASGPNAAPNTVLNVTGGGTLGTLNGVANSNSWPTGLGTTLSSPASGANPTMKFQKNGSGGFVTSGLSISPTDVLNLAWNEAYLATVTDGSNATGTITGTVGATTYTNTFTLAVKRSAVWSVPSPAVTGAALNTSQTTGARVVNDFNVPVTVTFANPTGPALPMTAGTISAIAGSNPAVSIILGTTTLTLNPGETLEVIGNTGGANDTEYGVKITVGTSAAQDWIVKTTAVPDAITAPTMAPTGGPLDPGLNSPAGITLSGGTYTPASGSPGAHVSTDWELYANGLPNTLQSTATISAVAPATLTVGTPAGGGYFAGQIRVPGGTGTIYNLIVAPVRGTTSGPDPAGTLLGQYSTNGGTSPASIQWKTSATGPDGGASQNEEYGKTWTDAAGALGATYPLFDWCVNSPTGPNGGGGIGGFTDWYIPAKNELEVLYYFLKPDATSNNTSSGSNPNAVAPEPVSTNYTASIPAQTTAAAFLLSGTEDFSTSSSYWSSTELSGSTSLAWTQTFFNGSQGSGELKSSNFYARAVRRVATTGSGSIQTLSITGANTDGFAVGQQIKGSSSGATGVITAIDGTSVTITQTSATNFNTTDKIEGNGTQVVPPPANPNSSNLVSLLVPQSSLATSTTYYSRARYRSATTTSPWASWASFNTASAFTILPGTQMGGGYFAGQIQDPASTGTIYNLIVAPVKGDNSGPNPSGTLSGVSSGSVRFKTTNTSGAGSNRVYGGSQTAANVSNALYPVYTQFINSSTGPNAGAFNLSTGGSGGGTGIGGYNDWYLPALYELWVIYFNLKPNSTTNDVSSGSQPNSVSPYTPNTNFGSGFPNVTGSSLFVSGGTEAFAAIPYWCSNDESGYIGPLYISTVNFGDGLASYSSIDSNPGRPARAIRRIPA